MSERNIQGWIKEKKLQIVGSAVLYWTAMACETRAVTEEFFDQTPTQTPVATVTLEIDPVQEPTVITTTIPEITQTPSNTPTSEQTQEPTITATATPEATHTPTPQDEETPTSSPTPTPTETPIPRTATPSPTQETLDLHEGLNRQLAADFVEHVNIARMSKGLEPLIVDLHLQAAAENYAALIHANSRHSELCSGTSTHINCHLIDGSPVDRAIRAGYPSENVTEVYRGLGSEDFSNLLSYIGEAKVLESMRNPIPYIELGLLTSRPHAEALLSQEYTDIGVGCFEGPNYFLMEKNNTSFSYLIICVGNLGNKD